MHSLYANLFVFLQAPSIPTDTSQLSATPSYVNVFSMISEIDAIGIAVLSIIFILSILSIYIFVERFLSIKKASKIRTLFMEHIRDYVANQNIKAAEDLCARENTPISRMVQKGLKDINKPLKDVKEAIDNIAGLEVFKLEKGLSTLATIAGAAPMIGFLGTVTGMINAFRQLKNAGSNIDPSMLAGGIYEAMFTTAAGLFVGIIAYIGYNLLVSMVQKAIFKMEGTAIDFIDIMQYSKTSN